MRVVPAGKRRQDKRSASSQLFLAPQPRRAGGPTCSWTDEAGSSRKATTPAICYWRERPLASIRGVLEMDVGGRAIRVAQHLRARYAPPCDSRRNNEVACTVQGSHRVCEQARCAAG